MESHITRHKNKYGFALVLAMFASLVKDTIIDALAGLMDMLVKHHG